MFHPLITPLTTYMYTTDIQDNGTVSATDAERLPPGGFSLRHGFPEWYGRGRRSTAAAKRAADQASATPGPHPQSAPTSESKSAGSTTVPEPSYMHTKQRTVALYDVLKYVRSTFDTEDVLDSLPLDAAGNPNAWHAWRTHRKKLGKLPADSAPSDQVEVKSGETEGAPTTAETKPAVATQQQVRDPSEWNWDGVWELRVKKAIAASLSEPVLYGGVTTGAGDDVVSAKLMLVSIGIFWRFTDVSRFGSRQWMRKTSSRSSRTCVERWKEVLKSCIGGLARWILPLVQGRQQDHC
jgi:hypothetical protein